MCFQGQAEKSLQLVHSAHELLPPDAFALRGYALTVDVISQCMSGNLNQARDTVAAALGEGDAAHSFRARALMSLAFLQWWTAEVSDARLTGFEGDIRWDTSKPNGQPRRCLDVGRAQAHLGWSSRCGFSTGLTRTIHSFRNSMEVPVVAVSAE